MNDQDSELFAAELRRLKPARPPEALLERLAAAAPRASSPAPHPSANPDGVSVWWKWARLWLPATAAAAAAIVVLAWRWSAPPGPPTPSAAVTPPLPTLRADGIEFGQQLLAAYDAVAEMPGGEPVRFRCREWMDEVVVHDSARGIVIEQRVPRLEVVPVCFETD